MAKRRRKRVNADGVALSEWVFFGLLVLAPIAVFGLYALVSGFCNIFLLQPGRYCSYDETIAWLWNDGGWWKLLIAISIIGLFAYLSCGEEKSRHTTQGEPGAGDRP